MVLMGVFVFLAFVAFVFRIDTPADRDFVWIADPILGALFGVALQQLGAARNSAEAGIIKAIVAWVLVSGLFLLWHEAQVNARWTISPRSLARQHVRLAQIALHDYARGTGSFPPQEQGLKALLIKPEASESSEPYLRAQDLIDPWGNALNYQVDGDRFDVWSNGPDGKSGTEDDVWLEDTVRDRTD